MSYPAPAKTDRNERIAKLAGCTPLAVELSNARVSVTGAMARHRKAQAVAGKHWASDADRARPAFTRQQVLSAVAKVRDIELQIEAKWSGYGQPVAPALPVFLMAAE